MMKSKNWMLAGVIAPVLFLAGCLVTPDYHSRSVLLAPPLPSIVVFDTEPYYAYQGFHYHYQNNRWYYSRSRSGPWSSLPRECYPREIRYRNRGHGHSTGPGLQVFIAPPLPPIVVFDREPYYVHQGCHYRFQNNGWYYSRSKSGPWTILPRDHYPREIRHKDGRRWDDKGHGTQTPHTSPGHHERVQPQEHKIPVLPPTKHPMSVQPPKEDKAPVLPPAKHPVTIPPSKEHKAPVVPPAKHASTVHPSEKQHIRVIPSAKHTETVQPPNELKRVEGQKPPTARRSGKKKSIQRKSPTKATEEAKDKAGHEDSQGPGNPSE